MNDDRCLQGLEKVGFQQHKVGKDECYPGVSNISKWLLRTIYDNLQDAENKRHALVSIGDSLEVISKQEYNQLRQDLIRWGYPADEVSRDFSDLESGDLTLPDDYKID